MVIEKYGSLKEIKYLITSFSDLKDTVASIKSIIETGCEKKDILRMAESIMISSIPLKNTLSSFILVLKIPNLILQSRYKHNLNQLHISPDNSKPQINVTGVKTLFRYELSSFYDLAQAIAQFIDILRKISPRIKFYNITKKTIIKTGKSAQNSTQTTMLFIAPTVPQNLALLNSFTNQQTNV
jgi:hypothetical protein